MSGRNIPTYKLNSGLYSINELKQFLTNILNINIIKQEIVFLKIISLFRFVFNVFLIECLEFKFVDDNLVWPDGN